MYKPANKWEKLSAMASMVTAITTVLLFIVGAGALYFANRQIQESRDQAKIQHLVELQLQFDQPPLAGFRKSLAAKRLDAKRENLVLLDTDNPPDEMSDVLNFFEHVSLLAKRGYLDKTDVWDEFGYWMFPVYEDAKPYIQNEQKNSKATYVNFSKLMEEMVSIEAKEENGALAHPGQDDIRDFYISEMANLPKTPLSHPHRRIPAQVK